MSKNKALKELKTLYLANKIPEKMYDTIESIVHLAGEPEEFTTEQLPEISELVIVKCKNKQHTIACFFLEFNFYKLDMVQIIPIHEILFWYRLNTPKTYNSKVVRTVNAHTYKTKEIRKCLNCNNEFTPSNDKQLFDTITCKYEYKRAKI